MVPCLHGPDALDAFTAELGEPFFAILFLDHGEECYEHGIWGHNGAFTPAQVHLRLVSHVPWMAPAAHD